MSSLHTVSISLRCSIRGEWSACPTHPRNHMLQFHLKDQAIPDAADGLALAVVVAGGERADPVLCGELLLLRRLLLGTQGLPILRPVRPQQGRLLQGRRRQRRHPLRPPRRMGPRRPPPPLARPPRRRRPLRRRLPPHLARRHGGRPGAAPSPLPLHAARRAGADLPQHRRCRHRRREFPRSTRHRHRHHEGQLSIPLIHPLSLSLSRYNLSHHFFN